MKILKNKRGFSLVELMVVVAIMGVLSAIAIPSYLSYQDSARQGVVESILYLVKRTVSIETARGRSLGSITAANLWERVESEAKNAFTDASLVYDESGDNWCFATDKPTGTGDYAGMQGCIDNTVGSPLVIGVDGIDCSALKTTGPSGTEVCALGCTPGDDPGDACSGASTATALTCTNGVCGV